MPIEKEITRIVADIIDMKEEGINPEANFIDDLGLDSLRALEILAALENNYKITIDPEKLREMTTLNNVIKITSQYVSANAGK